MTEAHLGLLRAAVDGTLPDLVTDTDPGSQFDTLVELVDARLLTASRNDTIYERVFYGINITLAGRAMLEQAKPDHAADPSAGVAYDEEGCLEKLAVVVCSAVLSAAAIWGIVHWSRVISP